MWLALRSRQGRSLSRVDLVSLGGIMAGEGDAMLKLYKRVDGVLRYHEAWVHADTLFEHWGVVGDIGQCVRHRLAAGANEDQSVVDILAPVAKKGFAPLEAKDHTTLAIEYLISGHGATADVDKRHALESRMNEVLGWSGLGHCDGGSIGSGSMEVFCLVVDFDIARRVIVADLEHTEFGDYTRIYRGNGGG